MNDDVVERRQKTFTCCNKIPPWFFPEVLHVFKLAWPMALTNFLQYLIFPISIAFCGHLGTIQLDAVALACTIISMFGISVSSGMATACDTLFSQNFGSGNYKRVGLLLQRGLFVMILTCVPCWAINLNTETILILAGQDKEVAYYAGRYVLIFMPGLMCNFIYQIFARYLQNQNKVMPVMIIGACANVVNALSHYILLYVIEDLGIDGSAISLCLANFTNVCGVISYIVISKMYKETWPGWNLKEAIKGWGEFAKYGIPGSLTLFLDFFCFEIGMIFTGILGTEYLAAQSIVHQVNVLTYMAPVGISVACSIRVGQRMGAENVVGAKRSVFAAIFLSLISAVITILMYITCANYLPLIFTTDPAVISITAGIFPIIAVMHLFDDIEVTLIGALQGLGRHNIGAGVLFFGYYFIGLPLGACLLFLTYLKGQGFWIGMATGISVNFIILTLIATKWLNWKKEMQLALERAGVTGQAKEGSLGAIDEAKNDEATGEPLMELTETKKLKVSIEDNHETKSFKYTILIRCLVIFAIALFMVIGIILRLTIDLSAHGTHSINETTYIT